jgi:hypothetical protein
MEKLAFDPMVGAALQQAIDFRAGGRFSQALFVILAEGLASDFTMGELGAYIFPRVLALSRPIATLLGIARLASLPAFSKPR